MTAIELAILVLWVGLVLLAARVGTYVGGGIIGAVMGAALGGVLPFVVGKASSALWRSRDLFSGGHGARGFEQ